MEIPLLLFPVTHLNETEVQFRTPRPRDVALLFLGPVLLLELQT